MNGDRSHGIILLFMRYHDKPVPVSANGHHAMRGGIEVSFFRKSHDLLDDGKVKAAQSRPMFQLLGPENHSRPSISPLQ